MDLTKEESCKIKRWMIRDIRHTLYERMKEISGYEFSKKKSYIQHVEKYIRMSGDFNSKENTN